MTNRGRYRSAKSRNEAFRQYCKDHQYDCEHCLLNPHDLPFNENVCKCFREWLDRRCCDDIEEDSKFRQKADDRLANDALNAIAKMRTRITQLEKALKPILEFDVDEKIDALEYGNYAESAIRQAQTLWKEIEQ